MLALSVQDTGILHPFAGLVLHRGWLPWVATSQLKGIFGLKDFDSELYRELSGSNAQGAD
jgi:hypothetical protein